MMIFLKLDLDNLKGFSFDIIILRILAHKGAVVGKAFSDNLSFALAFIRCSSSSKPVCVFPTTLKLFQDI